MSFKEKNRVYDSIVDLLPNEDNPTPLVRINRLAPNEQVELYAKLEWYNPFGSIKDRAAAQMVFDLEAQGALSAERGIVEPTSGNTGISLAALSAVRGYPMHSVVPNRIPDEKKMMLRILGATVEAVRDDLCPMPGLGEGSIGIAKAHAQASPEKYVMPNQYENMRNVEAHIKTTAPEIWKQTEGKITHLFVALGTCGTVTGLSTFLKEKNPDIKVYAVQPSEGHDIPGLRTVSQLASTTLYDQALIDAVLEIDYNVAYTRTLQLNQQEGLLASPCCGLIFEGAHRILQKSDSAIGVMIFPDNVFKYASIMRKHMDAVAVKPRSFREKHNI